MIGACDDESPQRQPLRRPGRWRGLLRSGWGKLLACDLAVMSARLRSRQKLAASAGEVEMEVVSAMALPTFARLANRRKCCRRAGVTISHSMHAENRTDVWKRILCKGQRQTCSHTKALHLSRQNQLDGSPVGFEMH